MNDRHPERRLAFIINSLHGGGAEKAVLTLARTLNRLGHQAHVISLEEHADYDVSHDMRVHRLPGRGRNALGLREFGAQARRLRALIGQLETENGGPFDLIVANLIEASHVVEHCGFDNVVHCVHQSIEGSERSLRARSLFRYLRLRRQWDVLQDKHLVTVSHGLGREIETSGRIRPASVRTIYNPIDVAAIRRQARDEAAGLPDGDYLIHVGRVARQKRHDLLLEAFSKVPRRYRLVLLTHSNARLRRMIEQHGLTDRVILPGFQTNPYPWIARARLMALSSDYEGLSLVSIEALACGTPLVATDCPHGPSEILTGELDRWLVPVGDSTGLAAAINLALETEIDVSRAEILEAVDPELVARQYLALADRGLSP
jgi:glycosyltransferase involved in cell wall biosynthesis